VTQVWGTPLVYHIHYSGHHFLEEDTLAPIICCFLFYFDSETSVARYASWVGQVYISFDLRSLTNTGTMRIFFA